jgi:hypothetical protein
VEEKGGTDMTEGYQEARGKIVTVAVLLCAVAGTIGIVRATRLEQMDAKYGFLGAAIMGLMEVITSVPLLLNLVPRNGLVGYRSQKTMASDEMWYKANSYLGRDSLWVGTVILVIGAASYPFADRMPAGACTAIWLIWVAMVLVILVRSSLYVRKL